MSSPQNSGHISAGVGSPLEFKAGAKVLARPFSPDPGQERSLSSPLFWGLVGCTEAAVRTGSPAAGQVETARQMGSDLQEWAGAGKLALHMESPEQQ